VKFSSLLFHNTYNLFVFCVDPQLNPADKPAPQLPCDFHFYDLDRDGSVKRDEFNLATAAYQNYRTSKSYDVFGIMDADCKSKTFHSQQLWKLLDEFLKILSKDF
jgi:hypothetical protein